MVSRIETIIRNTEFKLFLFSSLSQSKNKIKAKFARVKSAFSISFKKTSANFSIHKTYNYFKNPVNGLNDFKEVTV